MSLILITKRSGGTVRFHVGKIAGALLTTIAVGCLGGAVYLGYGLGFNEASPDSMMASLRKSLVDQRGELAEVSRVTQENMDALAVRLGQLKAHVIRLDALGQRLIEKAELDKGEFDFENPPGVGGPVDSSEGGAGHTMAVPDFLHSLDELSKQIEHRSLQLGVLETMLMNKDLQDEVYPAGRPVKRGWVSSYFGYRTDPFNGRIAHHDGIDIAGKWGADVVAVASGVVTWSGKRYGYGDLVEINHGNGYVTRYGHNQQVLVKVGDTVKKGQTVAAMGSSGRSTGPHVHFEVLLNGRVVDPIKYIRAAKDDE